MAESSSASDQKNMTLLCHLGGIILGFIPSLLIYLLKGEDATLREHAKQALNFQLAVLVAVVVVSIVAGFLPFLGFVNLLIWLANVALCIMAALKANEGQVYEYPISLPVIK